MEIVNSLARLTILTLKLKVMFDLWQLLGWQTARHVRENNHDLK